MLIIGRDYHPSFQHFVEIGEIGDMKSGTDVKSGTDGTFSDILPAMARRIAIMNGPHDITQRQLTAKEGRSCRATGNATNAAGAEV